MKRLVREFVKEGGRTYQDIDLVHDSVLRLEPGDGIVGRLNNVQKTKLEIKAGLDEFTIEEDIERGHCAMREGKSARKYL